MSVAESSGLIADSVPGISTENSLPTPGVSSDCQDDSVSVARSDYINNLLVHFFLPW